MTTSLEKTRGCVNFQLRRTAREVGRYYDDALRDLDLHTSQFNVMSVLAQAGPLTVTNLATRLGIERSALARNLMPLERKRFVTVSLGTDRRTRMVQLSAAGRRKLDQALPIWSDVQDKLVERIGRERTASLTVLLTLIRAAITS